MNLALPLHHTNKPLISLVSIYAVIIIHKLGIFVWEETFLYFFQCGTCFRYSCGTQKKLSSWLQISARLMCNKNYSSYMLLVNAVSTDTSYLFHCIYMWIRYLFHNFRITGKIGVNFCNNFYVVTFMWRLVNKFLCKFHYT